VDHAEEVVVEDARAALLVEVVVLVLGSHRLLGVDAVQVLEVGAVVFDHLAEDLRLHLFEELLEGVAVDEEALAGGVGVEVEEEVDFLE
jgi:hypothetical protein